MSLTFHKVATVNEIGDGEAKHVEIGDKQIGLFRLGDEYFAIDDICSHAYALLSEGFIENDEVECPLHAGKFDRDFPVHVELPPWPDDAGEAEQIHDDVVGELAIERLLRERGYDDAKATRAAIGWDGDRLALWRTPSGEQVIIWRSVWDREEDADQFAGAIAPFSKDEPRGFRIVRRGRIVDAVSAESEDVATKWYITLQDALDSLAIEPSDAVSTREAEAEPPARSR